MTFHQALAILKKDEEEERNWRSARTKLIEVLEAATAAYTALEPVAKEKAALVSDVAALRTAHQVLQHDHASLQTAHGQLGQEYRAEKQRLEDSLAGHRADIVAAQQLKLEAENHLAELKAKFA